MAVPAAVAVTVPTTVVFFADRGEPQAEYDELASLREQAVEREAPVGRGSADRSSAPEPPPELPRPAGTVSPEATEEPEEPEPEPSESPSQEAESEAEPEPEPTAVGEMYATTPLNVRTGPGAHAQVVTVLETGATVAVTGESDGSWVQIIRSDELYWVSGEYLSETEPEPEPEPETREDADDGGGPSMAECQHGSSVENGLTQDAIRVHRAVCAEFPDVSSYGGLRSGGGAHSEGRALDIMVTGSLGDQIAEWVRKHHKELGVSEVIWAQRIWTVQRSSEGWRPMEDRGSDTANHYDHVHVTVYGDSGTL